MSSAPFVTTECGGIPEMLDFRSGLWVKTHPWCHVNTLYLEGHIQFVDVSSLWSQDFQGNVTLRALVLAAVT